MAESISRNFARWAGALRFEDLPLAVLDKLRALLAFHLVAVSFGAEEAHAQALVELVKAESAKPDGATILVDGTTVAREGAVLANCELAHVAGLWDSFRMITHPGPVLGAVALVTAELGHRSAREMVTALAAGYEFTCRLADDFVPSVAARGFRPAPIFATMGAALTAGKLLALDEDELVTAIAIAASSASGLNEPGRVGGGEAIFHEPNAARQGMFAALMAGLGRVRGSESSIEGPAGFYATYAGSRDGALSYVFEGPRRVDLASVTEGLGSTYKLLGVMFRMYNTSGYNQPVIDLMAELVARHRLDPSEIAEVVISMNYLETLYPSPEFPRFADPSLPRVGSTQFFAAYVALHGSFPVVGAATPGPAGHAATGGGFPSGLADDRPVLDFMTSKVRLVGVHDQPMFSPHISVQMTSGLAYSQSYPYARMAWGYDELAVNLARCVPRLPGGARALERLLTAVGDLEHHDSVAPLIAAVGRN